MEKLRHSQRVPPDIITYSAMVTCCEMLGTSLLGIDEGGVK